MDTREPPNSLQNVFGLLYIGREVLVRVGSPEGISPRVLSTPGELTMTRTYMQVNDYLFLETWEHLKIGGLTPWHKSLFVFYWWSSIFWGAKFHYFLTRKLGNFWKI
jgi:hypothetical protein